MKHNGYNLFQKGHFQYEICIGTKCIKTVMGSCEEAVSILMNEFGV